MESANHGTIERSHPRLRTVSRRRGTVRLERSHQALVGVSQIVKRVLSRQVETIPQIDHCAQHIRLNYPLFSLGFFHRKLVSAFRIRLPKINSRSQPIVVVLTRLEIRLSCKNPLANLAVAAVITEDETCRESMHQATGSSLRAYPIWSGCLLLPVGREPPLESQ